MSEKTPIEKLQILLPHWIEHNHNHEAEFKKWAEQIRHIGENGIADLLDQAIASMGETDKILAEALEKLGGPAPGHDHHHHGHHHD